MNEDVLSNLANGVQVCNTVNALDPTVIAALAAAVTTQKQVTQISSPVNTKTIDTTALGGGVQNQTEFTFTNNTAVPIIYWFTGLFNEPGDASDFGIAGNSAFDFPAAQGSGAHPEAGGSDLRVFNKKAQVIGYIIGQVEITTSLTAAQQRQELLVNTENVENTPCNSRRLAPICDTCNNNSNSTTFTARFKCPLAVGGNMSFGYTVLPGESVNIRVTSIGEAVSQFKSLGGDCACN